MLSGPQSLCPPLNTCRIPPCVPAFPDADVAADTRADAAADAGAGSRR
jgi:hypothetical protein